MRKKAEPRGHTHLLHNRHKPMIVHRCLPDVHFDKLFQTLESTSFGLNLFENTVRRFHLKCIVFLADADTAAIFTVTCIYCFLHSVDITKHIFTCSGQSHLTKD